MSSWFLVTNPTKRTSSKLTFIQIKNFAEPFVESIPQFFLLLVTKYACPVNDVHETGPNLNATNLTNVGDASCLKDGIEPGFNEFFFWFTISSSLLQGTFRSDFFYKID